MNKKQIIIKFSVIATLGFLILGLLPVVQASPPPFIQELEGMDNLAFPWFNGQWIEDPPGSGNYYYSIPVANFNSSRNLHFKMGAGRSIEEKVNDWWPNPPWEYRLYINGVEFELQKYAIKLEADTNDPPVLFYWYYIFGPQYFTPGGEYVVKFEFWVKGPYQGDDLNYWRIFIDYEGIGFPAGTAFSFEYNINIF